MGTPSEWDMKMLITISPHTKRANQTPTGQFITPQTMQVDSKFGHFLRRRFYQLLTALEYGYQ